MNKGNRSVIDFKYNEVSEVLQNENKINELCTSLNYGINKINVLLLAMSTLSKSANITEYVFENGSEHISGKYCSQLEPVPKVLAQMLAKKGERIDYIFVLNTDVTCQEKHEIRGFDKELNLSAFDFFKNRCCCLFNDDVDDRVINIPLFKGDRKDTIENGLSTFYRQIKKIEVDDIDFYLDIHGGLRNQSIVTDAILQLLNNEENYHLKDVYTVEFNNSKGTVYSCHNQIKVFDFISGINEFLNFGSSKSLVKFIKDQHISDNGLVEAINKVSESIRLCNMDSFSVNLKHLQEVIIKCKKDDFNGYFDVVLDMITKDYRLKNGKNLLLNTDDLLLKIEWCVKKEYIQQALTMIEDKTAEYLYNKKISCFDDYLQVSGIKNIKKKEINSLHNNFINIGLFIPKETDKKFKGIYVDKRYFYFKEDIYLKDKLFSNNVISLLEDERFDDIVLEIKKESNPKYDKQICEYQSNRKPDKSYSESIKNYLDYDYIPVPINELLIGTEAVDYYFVLMYVQKKLKELRNQLNHGNNRTNFCINDINKMIYLYIVLMEKLENIANKYL